MKDREQAIVDRIAQGLEMNKAREFFVKADSEINIRDIGQELVNRGFGIDEYSFGEQKDKNGVSLGKMHRLIVRRGEKTSGPVKPKGTSTDYEDLLSQFFGKLK